MRWRRDSQRTSPTPCHLCTPLPAAIQADLSAGGPAKTSGPLNVTDLIRPRGLNKQSGGRRGDGSSRPCSVLDTLHNSSERGSVWCRLSASIQVIWQARVTYSVRTERSWAMALSGSAGASPDGTLQSQR